MDKVEELTSQIKNLTDAEKLRLVETVLEDLDRPDPELDRIWADEARRRLAAYREGRVATASYDDVMAKHRRP